jgi:hypothetical protein
LLRCDVMREALTNVASKDCCDYAPRKSRSCSGIRNPSNTSSLHHSR